MAGKCNQSKFYQVGNNYVLFVTKKLKKVMLTDSVKAPLKLEELPIPLTVMKELHKQSAKRYLKCILGACQVSPIVTRSTPKKQRKVHAKQTIQKVVQTLEDTFNTSICKELCCNQDQTELPTSWVECIEKRFK